MTDELVVAAPAVPAPLKLTQRIAERFGVEARQLVECYKNVCFRQGKDSAPITDSQLLALLVVTEQYNLNPLTKELFAFDDRRGGIIPYISYDGWVRIVNARPEYDGCTLLWDEQQQSVTCTMFRKDRAHPTIVTEYLAEARRPTDAWNKSPRRMLRNRCFTQAARLCFGFALYDEDEAMRVRDIVAAGGEVQQPQRSAQRASLAQALAARVEPQVIESMDDLDVEAEYQLLLADLSKCQTTDDVAQLLQRAAAILGPEELAALSHECELQFNQPE